MNRLDFNEIRCLNYTADYTNNNTYILACVTSVALAVFSGFVLCRYFNCSKSLGPTNLRNYIVVTPSHEDPFLKLSEIERQKIYKQAKKHITSLSEDVTSKVDFCDYHLEIGFKYGEHTLSAFANHEKLWFIFSEKDCFQPFTRDTIFNSSSTRFCVKNLMGSRSQLFKEISDFDKESRLFFDNEVTIKAAPNFTAEYFVNCSDLIDAIFKKSKGLSLGELHREGASQCFLMSQMQALVNSNVETVFLEGFWENVQADLDKYFDPKTDTESMPLSIQYNHGYLNEILKSNGDYTWIDVIKAAKNAGIKRIVGIDSELTVDDSSEKRLRTMNYHAKKIIEREMPQGNYLIISGLAHTTTSGNIPGFSQLLGIPSVFVCKGHVPRISNTQALKSTLVTLDEGKSDFYVDFRVFVQKCQQNQK